MTKHEMELD